MQERHLGRLRPDMDVCDVAGEKVGMIARVYRYADAAVADGGPAIPAIPAATGSERPPYDEVIEVKTGFLGLGSHLYIPISAIQDALADSIFLSKSRGEFEALGWHEKPPYLDELR